MINKLGIKKFILLNLLLFSVFSIISFSLLAYKENIKSKTNVYALEKAQTNSIFLLTLLDRLSDFQTELGVLVTEKDLDKLEKNIALIKLEQEKIEKIITNCPLDSCDDLKKSLAAYFKNTNFLISDKILKGKLAEALDFYVHTLLPDYKNVNLSIQKIQKSLNSLNTLINQNARNNAFSQIKIMIIFAIIFNVLLIAGGIIASKMLIKTITEMNTKLLETSQKVKDTAEIISTNSDKVLQTSVLQNVSVQNASTSLRQITTFEEDNIKNIIEINNDSQKNHAAIEQGKESFEIMNKSIKIIRDSNNQIIFQISKNENEFNKVIELIKEINTKTKIINEIAFQTKLLSFNASVEAARAGEHGKGFAVVAQEIGNLANLSSNSADEISALLGKSVQRVNEILRNGQEEMGNIVADALEKIEEGSKIALECQKVFFKIDDDRKNTNSNLDTVTQNAEQLKSKIVEINSVMQSIVDLANDNEKMVSQYYKLSSDLLKQNKEVEKFSIDFNDLVYSKKQ